MSEGIKPTVNEMMAGNGAALQIPPAFVMVNPRSHRRYKKANQDKVDGRTKGAKKMLSRIQSRKKMKEDLELKTISEAPSETERAQKQIGQMKKLNRAKDLQKKRDEAKKKMQGKTKEMDILMKARMSDFKKKASDQTKKLKKEETEVTTNMITETTAQQDALDVAMQVATSEQILRENLTSPRLHLAMVLNKTWTIFQRSVSLLAMHSYLMSIRPSSATC